MTHGRYSAARSVSSLGESPCGSTGGTLNCLPAELCLHRRAENRAVSLKPFSDWSSYMRYLRGRIKYHIHSPQKCFAYMREDSLPRFLLNSILILTAKNLQAAFHTLRNYASFVTAEAQFCQAVRSSWPCSVGGQARITEHSLKRCLTLAATACLVVTFHNSL